MAVEWGVNCTQDGSDRPTGTVGTWRRFVVSDPHAVQTALAYKAQGHKVIAVAAKEVIYRLGNDPQATPRAFFDTFGFADACQVWNEPDGADDDSDVTDRATYQTWLWAFRDEAARRAWPGILVAAGLVSGNPEWLHGIDLTGGYRLAVHLYDVKPYAGYVDWGHGDLPSVLDAYAPYVPPGTNIWLTEISRTTQDEAVQARYADAIVRSIAARPDVAFAGWYCYRDWHVGRVPRPFGLVRADGSAKPTLATWSHAVKEVSVALPPWQDPSWQFPVGEGVGWAMKSNGDHPTGPEAYLPDGLTSITPGEKFLYTYSKPGNATYQQANVLTPKAPRLGNW